MENCELIKIDGQYIGNFMIDDIKKSISKHYNSITEMEMCSLFAIAINRRANGDYQAFDLDGEENRHNIFERLSSGDICTVDIVYDDGSENKFHVDWSGESEYKNSAQDSYTSELGDLFIVISKESNVKAFFGSWNIDKQGIIDLMWSFK